MSTEKIVAIYARVSSERQAKAGTIDSQVAALKEHIEANGESVAEAMIFTDAGISGATLIRPELEKLRDAAGLGQVDRVYILSPDRLSRKYAHQVLLIEEFQDCGVELVFLNHAVGTTPEDELLLQMQGMIAEYERAKIMERNRRGKLHGARRGSVNVLSGAPYGYRYIPKQSDGNTAQYMIDLAQAKTVRQIFHWIGVDRLSIGEVVRRLGEQGVQTQTGKAHWDRSVVWGMLQNPAYMGRAAFGKTQAIAPLPRPRPQRHSAETRKKSYSTARQDRANWIEISVPALISEGLYHAVQAQLEENRRYARERRRGAAYLLQGLIVCGHCQYAYYGKKVSKASSKGKGYYAYYRCIGTDAYRFGGERICHNKQIRTVTLDECVWAQVVDILNDPQRLKDEYERRLDVIDSERAQAWDVAELERQRFKLEKSKSRLIDSFSEGVIEKTDFNPKIAQLKVKIERIDAQLEQSKKNVSGQHELFLVINRLEEFSNRVRDRLTTVDFNEKREIIRSLVKRVEIRAEEVIVIFRVNPDRGFDPGMGDSSNPTADGKSNGSKIMLDRSRRNSAFLPQSLQAIVMPI